MAGAWTGALLPQLLRPLRVTLLLGELGLGVEQRPLLLQGNSSAWAAISAALRSFSFTRL